MAIKKVNSSNLASPVSISSTIDIANVKAWYLKEISNLNNECYIELLKHIINNQEDYVRWTAMESPILLWKGSTRELKYHSYSINIKTLAKEKSITLDGRANGPAKAAFDFAGGIRPSRYGSTNTWYCNHIYSGKYPYLGKENTLHAVKDGNHFTQSCGIVALHPIANAAFDEYPEFAWYLRALAFLKYRYDPDSCFGKSNEFGFIDGVVPKIIDNL